MRTPVLRSLGLILLLATSGVVGACGGCNREGPAERAGEAIDDAADEAEDAVD